MMLLYVICALPSPIKNPGYAYLTDDLPDVNSTAELSANLWTNYEEMTSNKYLMQQNVCKKDDNN